MSTLTISVDRSGLGLSPLVFSGTKAGTALGIVGFYPPAYTARNGYAPDSADIDGSELISTSWQQAILGWDWTPIGAADQAAVQAARAAVLAAIGQFSFTVTTQVSGAPAEVWSGDRGTMQLGGSSGLTHIDLQTLRPVYSITVPVYPVPA